MSGKKADVGFGIRRELVAFKRMPHEVDVFGGVCAAIAYRLALPTWVVRLTFFLWVLPYGAGVWAYLLLWAFVPRASKLPADYVARTGHSSD